MFTSSGIVDINCVSVSGTSTTLERLAVLTQNHTINIVTGNRIEQEHIEPSYFTTSFPTLFPYGTGGFLDDRRRKPLSQAKWQSLLLRHSSRSEIPDFLSDRSADSFSLTRRSSCFCSTSKDVALHSSKETSTLRTRTGIR